MLIRDLLLEKGRNVETIGADQTIHSAIQRLNRHRIGALVVTGSADDSIVRWLGAAGLVMALPVIISLLLINIGMGVVSRAAPQLNIFAIGFPVTLLMGFVLIWMTIPQVMSSFGGLVTETFDRSAIVLGTR